jgi:DNA polymerase III subunit gamma/tau
MSLYRKYRPQKFEEIIGQEHVVQTLMGAIESDQIGHAYIFAGTRGTGKTSIARIFAKSVNCQKRNGFEPCGQCQICVEMHNGTFLDLIEIDAASNRGIDEIRDLKEKIRFAPNLGKYKVYIIDEAHMLTEPAFNALLKTLEEPPKHVIFILATTEIHKIPITILSRCQRFDFHKVESNKMFESIKNIAKIEKIKIDDENLKKIISISEGSVRDALSYLDQLNSFSGGEISSNVLENILGYSNEEKLLEFLDLVTKQELKTVMAFIDKLVEDGTDVEGFLKNLIVILRKILILKIDENSKNDFFDFEKAKKISDFFSLEQIIGLIDTLNGVFKNSKFSFIPQLVLELEIIKFISAKPKSDSKKSEAINITGKIVNEIKSVLKQNNKNEGSQIIEKQSGVIGAPNDKWNSFIEKIKNEKIILYMALQGCDFEINDNMIKIKISNGFYLNRLNEKQNFDFIDGIAKDFFGQKIKLIIEEAKKNKAKIDIIGDALTVFGGELIE